HLIGKTITNRVRDAERRAAGSLLRSPYGLAPQPAGATSQFVGLRLGLRRHDAPFRSCLHRASQCQAERALRARSTAFCAFVASARRAAREVVRDRPAWLERSLVSPRLGSARRPVRRSPTSSEGATRMVIIGIDAHKYTHTAV